VIEHLALSLGVTPDDPSFWLPLALMAILLALIVGGAILDGFDIGVGLLLGVAPKNERDHMMQQLGPWHHANASWLPLGAGLFAAAFPYAWGEMLTQLYAPLMLMLCGTVLRSVSATFRLRSPAAVRARWIAAYWAGSLLCALAHGLLLAGVVTAYQNPPGQAGFALFIGLCGVFAYALLGATWLIMRVHGTLQACAVNWARHSVRWMAAGMVAVAMVLALSNAGILYQWANLSGLASLALLWVGMLACFVGIELSLARLPSEGDKVLAALPFACCVLLFLTMLLGLAYSLFPYLILDVMTIWDAAADAASLRWILAGTVVLAPIWLLFNMQTYPSAFGRDALNGSTMMADRPPPGV